MWVDGRRVVRNVDGVCGGRGGVRVEGHTSVEGLEVLQVSIELADLLTALLQHAAHTEHSSVVLH